MSLNILRDACHLRKLQLTSSSTPRVPLRGACRLTTITQLEVFLSYLRALQEELSSSFAEVMEQIRYRKHPQYTDDILHFPSIQSHLLMQKYNKLLALLVISKLKSRGFNNSNAFIALEAMTVPPKMLYLYLIK